MPKKEEFALIFHFVITNEMYYMNHKQNPKFNGYYLNQWNKMLEKLRQAKDISEIKLANLNSSRQKRNQKRLSNQEKTGSDLFLSY